MRIDRTTLQKLVVQLPEVERQRVKLGRLPWDADFVVTRSSHCAEFAISLRSLEWFTSIAIPEQHLLDSQPSRMIDLLTDAIARGAANLRGSIIDDLLTGIHERPINLRGVGSHEEQLQRCERMAVHLMSLVERNRDET